MLLIRSVTVLMLFATASQIQAQDVPVPDSARPGAIRPELDGRPTLPQQPPDAVFETPGSVLEVPAVIDRPFEIDDGPKVIVRSFRLIDAVNLPGYGISLAEMDVILQQQANARPEGFTVGQLQLAADQITLYYRSKGLILAQAVVPVQTVDAGVVSIQVFVGTLGRVIVEGNQVYKESTLHAPFTNLVGEPVTQASIEAALLQLTDFPGLTVFGIFQPGQIVGTADIVLTVQGEDRFNFSYRVDTHGLPETGEYRFRPTFVWNNVTGTADRLNLSLQQTYNPKNNSFYSADYDRYLGRGITAGIGWNENTFDVGGDLAAQEIRGATTQYSGFVDKTWIRSRQMNLSTRLGLTHKNSATTTRDRQTNQDKLTAVSLSTVFDNVDTRFRGINFATLDFSQGFNNFLGSMGSSADADALEIGDRPSRRGGPADDRFAEGKFTKVFATASRLQTINTDYGLSLLARAEYQWSNDLLVPLEQYSVGGPDNVRAYPPAQQLLDRAYFYSFELIKNMPFIGDKPAFNNRSWGEVLQLSIFYDFAVGRLNKPLTSDVQEGVGGYVNFRGAGLQARFTLPGLIESRIMMARRLGDTEADNGRTNQYWLDFTYRF